MFLSLLTYVLTALERSQSMNQESNLAWNTSIWRKWIEFTTFFHFPAAHQRQSLTLYEPAGLNTLYTEHKPILGAKLGPERVLCDGNPMDRSLRLRPKLAMCSQSNQPFYEQPSFNSFLRETDPNRTHRERRALSALYRF